MFTALVVVVVAIAVATEVSGGGRFDATGDTALISTTRTETVTDVFLFSAPDLIVRASGEVTVELGTGPAGQVTVRREVTWSGPSPDITQSWTGRTLRVDVRCLCTAKYTVTVPQGVPVQRR
ncbi:hypothetical protein [Acrocarpospora catenulata]|uniref:hypothetical protein n=1 Tax=Acrocarpospora catenulata TaxID=2836182 RepID=UPI001BD9A5D5|nr:hypothetical protein [Acrocarpospora catenulata]